MKMLKNIKYLLHKLKSYRLKVLNVQFYTNFLYFNNQNFLQLFKKSILIIYKR